MKIIVRLAALGNLIGGGIMVAVVVLNPHAPIARNIGLGVGGAVCLLVGLVLMVGASKIGPNKLLTTGVPAKAVIKTVRETGISMNHGMYVILDFHLEVNSGTGSAYMVACRSTVPRLALSSVGLGKKLAIKVDPMNPNNVAIDWNVAPA